MATGISQCDRVEEGRRTDPLEWRKALGDSVRDAASLCRLLDLSSSTFGCAETSGNAGSQPEFGVLVPRHYVARIEPGNPDDPLLLQVLPREAERAPRPGFTTDPVGESDTPRESGLLQKYPGRALILTTGRCGVHCRFCFRRHFRGKEITPEGWESLFRHLAADGSIREVILSGGDPLMLGDDQLAQIARRLAEISHLRRLRIHTRLPIVIPQRVTEDLLAWLREGKLAPVVAIHVNHPAEIDRGVAAALRRLVDGGVPVLSQSVLLRGINDRVEVLAELFERLVDLRVVPYYLHQLDRVAGAAHFEAPECEGAKLVELLRARLPGYAVPRYVRETAGAPGKCVLA